ncbi:MAG: hypothetical protein ACF8R7_04065 [Phycisphaerales bacterium JB039]
MKRWRRTLVDVTPTTASALLLHMEAPMTRSLIVPVRAMLSGLFPLGVMLPAGCSIDLQSVTYTVGVTPVFVGGEEVVSPQDDATGLQEAAARVRAAVASAAIDEPLSLIGMDGKALLVSEGAREDGPILIWRDWTAQAAPVRLDEAKNPRFVSTRHFIYTRSGSLQLADVCDPHIAVPVAASIDEGSLRIFPGSKLWTANAPDGVLVGRVDGAVDAAGARAVSLDHAPGLVAALEDDNLLLVEAGPERIAVIDVEAAARVPADLHGVIDWPYQMAALDGQHYIPILQGASTKSLVWADSSGGIQIVPLINHHTEVSPRSLLLTVPIYDRVVFPPYEPGPWDPFIGAALLSLEQSQQEQPEQEHGATMPTSYKVWLPYKKVTSAQ